MIYLLNAIGLPPTHSVHLCVLCGVCEQEATYLPIGHGADLLLGAFAKFRKANVSIVMSVRPSAWNS
jgi:hypothetical protein